MSAAMRKPRRTGTLAPGREPLTKFQMKSGRYEEATHADPDRPMFEEDKKGRLVQVGFHERRGLRAVVGYHVLWAQGLITDDMHEAADRLTMALEWAQGAKEGGADFTGVRLAPWQKGHPSARQIQAAADLADARGVLGLGSYENAVSAIGANVWPFEWGGGSPAPQHWDRLPKEALDHLRASLQILVQVWRIDA